MPAFPLKRYQSQALDALDRFLIDAQADGVEAAWQQALRREGMPAQPYQTDGLGDSAPMVCLRIPTGGGKTLLAAHAIVRMARHATQRSHPVALWLVPSDAIRQQTLQALQTVGHPYRAALEAAYGDALTVCALDALHTVPAADWGRRAIVAVATIQSLRTSNKDGRRAHRMSEDWEPHFRSRPLTPQQIADSGLALVQPADVADPEQQRVLTAADVGRVKMSLANWLALQRPVVIVDEAHNTKTPLSLGMLRDLRPSCVLDLTATPVPGKTNVLYRVSALELEAEAMIKLPVLVAEHPEGWQSAVRDAILRRRQLEGDAAREADYIRPIVLFQAQDAGGTVTVDVLRQHLLQEHAIPEAEIARATGHYRELDGVALGQPGPVRYVITVDALREGWDCPFAYVLCSLQPLNSQTAVEQLLGRVLRMPYATRRRSPALNRAYAHVLSRRVGEAANALVDRMVDQMGFDPHAAAAAVWQDCGGGLFADQPAAPPPAPVLEIAWNAAAHDAAALRDALAGQPDVLVLDDGGQPMLRVEGEVTDAQRDAIVALALPQDRPLVEARLDQHAARLQAARAPADRGTPFAPVPRLCVRWQGELELVERHTLEDLVAFDLQAADPQPRLDGFAIAEQNDFFEVYLDGARIRHRQADAAQLVLDGIPSSASEADLVRLLEREVRRPGLTQADTQRYVQRIVAHLLHERHLPLTGLLRSRFVLARAIAQRIDGMEAVTRSQGFQQLLLGRMADAELVHDPLRVFRFEAGRYPVRDVYVGRFQFRKHFFREIGGLKSSGEEHDCARTIDAMPQVRHWVRNLERQPELSFWLPTATDYFYPDFVAELLDGRLLVVEYKGEHLAHGPDTQEKRLVGSEWARRTGQCFAMVERELGGMGMADQLRAAITA